MTRERRRPESIERKNRRRSLNEVERKKRSKINLEEDIPRKNNKNKKRKKKRKNTNMPIAKKAMIVTASIVILLVVGLIVGIISFLGNLESSTTIGGVAPDRGEALNILLLGMDIGDPNQVHNDGIKRTDTIMLVNYNPNSESVKMVSIPRDTLVNKNGKSYKINSAYQMGGDANIKRIVEEMLSVNINYIVKIDYEAFRNFIDAIGGIDIDIDRNMIYDDNVQNLHINLKKGPNQHLNGSQAEGFFRWRKNNDGSGFANGDLDRIDNQHKFMRKVVDKFSNPFIIFKVPKILKSISKNVETNMPINKIISYGIKFSGIDSNNFDMTTINGEARMIGGQSYVVFNKDSNKQLISSLHSSLKVSSGIKKEHVKILLLNGTKINGLASQVKGDLNVAGWTRVDTGNANPAQKSEIMTNDDDIKTLLNADMPKVKKSSNKPDDERYASYDVVVILGNDYKKLGE